MPKPTRLARRSILKSAARLLTRLLDLRDVRQWVLRKILRRWVRVTVKPDDAAAAIAARLRPVCYVLERESAPDLAVLSIVCASLKLPSPDKACFAMGARTPRHLVQLVAAAAADPKVDADLVPVAIFWGGRRARRRAYGACCSPKIGRWSGASASS